MPPGYKAKDLVGAPWLVAMELRRRGWYLRCDIIWDKLGAMPEKVTDRPTRNHEYVFLLSKSERYDCDMSVIAEIMANGKPKNRRAIWRISKQNCPAMHSAVFPDKLAQLCILSGSHTGDTVLDPFMGSGTTGKVAISLDRDFIGIELNPAYCLIAQSKMENY
jgi:site-specific DNA-methyltransferase (adenine-specific)